MLSRRPPNGSRFRVPGSKLCMERWSRPAGPAPDVCLAASRQVKPTTDLCTSCVRHQRRDPAGRESAPRCLHTIARMHGRCALWSAAVPAAPRRPSSQCLLHRRVGVFRRPSAYSPRPAFPIASSSAKGFPRNTRYIFFWGTIYRSQSLLHQRRDSHVPTAWRSSCADDCLNRFFISEGIPTYRWRPAGRPLPGHPPAITLERRFCAPRRSFPST